MSDRPKRKTAQLVVKISKYCNLRCSYCYEFKELANKQRMALDDIRRMFVAMREHALASSLEDIEFVWHGGEPLLIPLDYYIAIQAIQKEVFPANLKVTNTTQTNLTILTDRHLDFLKTGGFFDGIGISFDVYGDQRVDAQGKLRTDTILANLRKLAQNGIQYGAITVLARNTLGASRNIYRFWDKLGVSFRFLPFHLSAMESQVDSHALTGEEIAMALNQIFLDWLASDRATPVEPIATYLRFATAYVSGAIDTSTFNRKTDEGVFVVNLDGGVFGIGAGEIYGPEYSYGNIFTDKLDAILSSPGRQRVVAEADARMATYCHACPYWGYCPGDFVADASREEIATLERSGCTVAKVLDHMTATLRKLDFGDALKAEQMPQVENAALSVRL